MQVRLPKVLFVMLTKVRRDVTTIFSVLMGLGALSLFLFSFIGNQDHWLMWPAFLSGVILIFVSPCMLAGAYCVLAVLEWKKGVVGRGRLFSSLVAARIGFAAAAFTVLLQVGAAYIEMQSFERIAPAVDQRLLMLAGDRAGVDLADENTETAHELYAEAQFLSSGSVHIVTTSDGEARVFFPDVNSLKLREDINKRRFKSAIVIATLLISAGFCTLFLFLCLIAVFRWV